MDFFVFSVRARSCEKRLTELWCSDLSDPWNPNKFVQPLGLMKLFDNASDKEKKRPAVIRRQTMSGSEISRKKVKRRSYNGPFPDNDTKGYERNAEDVTNTYDALRPNFIFLQFYHSSWFGEDDIPLALPEEEVCL